MSTCPFQLLLGKTTHHLSFFWLEHLFGNRMSITSMEKNLRFDFASKFLKEPFEFWNGAIFISEIQSRLVD